MIQTVIYAISLVLAVVCGWNLHAVWANHRYYQIRHTLTVMLDGLTASNITDIDLDQIRDELQGRSH